METPIDNTDPFVALATEIGHLGRRLDRIGSELIVLRRAPSQGPPPVAGSPPHHGAGSATPPPGTPPGWTPAGGWADPRQYPPGRPPPWYRPAGPRPRPASPSAPSRIRTGLSALSGARLLAWTGGAVTLLGIVLLLVLAASRGWFSPGARVGAGAVLGVALIALSLRLHRREAGHTGALALAGTGFAALYLVVAGATLVLGLAPVPAVLLALLVAAGGLGLADRWRAQLLAGGVVVGGALLAPVLAGGPLLVALVLALQVAAVAVVWRRQWTPLALLSAAGPVLYGVGLALLDGTPGETVAVVLGVLLVGLGAAAGATRRLPAGPVAALVAAAPVPVLAAVPILDRWGGAALAAGAALALLALAALPGTATVVRQVGAAAAAVAFFQATAVALDGSTRTAVLLGQATVLAILAAVLRRRLAIAVAAGYATVGVLAALVVDAPLDALVIFPEPLPDTGALVARAVVSALVLVLAIALVVAGGRLRLIRPDAGTAWLWVPAGIVGLYGATGLVVTLALLVAPDRTGFTAGHALVT
ncbi:MAG: DUF2339 domain-containing protein, partial [Pseudonocardia sp.]